MIQGTKCGRDVLWKLGAGGGVDSIGNEEKDGSAVEVFFFDAPPI
jgi:hypothetical protein